MLQSQIPGIASLPPHPRSTPLNWKERADAFDRFVMDAANGVRHTTPTGHAAFAAFLASERYATTEHELVTYGPIVLGKLLRGDDVGDFLPTLIDYYNAEAGIFLNRPGDSRCELWYLMYANSLAAHIIRRAGMRPEWAQAWRRSLEALQAMARRLDYDFNHQGYDFAADAPWTDRDMYRQPDAIGGYAYLMLLGSEMIAGEPWRAEAEQALARYLAMPENPWYEVPDGCMAALAAARLNATGGSFDLGKALAWLLDPKAALVVGEWNHQEVHGLSRGWRHSAPESAYSMESLMILPHILPVVRYDPTFARSVGCYALHVAANARLFFSDFARGAESRADLSPAVAYERLLREYEGHSPYATGDFAGHKSVYGGAYALWWGAVAQTASDPQILQLDLTATDFLATAAHPTYLFYNPWPEARCVELSAGERGSDLYDLTAHCFVAHGVRGAAPIDLPAHSTRVLAMLPAGAKQHRQGDWLLVDGVPVDFHAGVPQHPLPDRLPSP